MPELIPTEQPQEEGKDYFSMTYREVVELPPEELAEAAAEAGVSVERFLAIKQRSAELSGGGADFVPSKDLILPKAPETTMHTILGALSGIALPTHISLEEVEQADADEKEAYLFVEKASERNLGAQMTNSYNASAIRLFTSVLRTRFFEAYLAKKQQGIADEVALDNTVKEWAERNRRGANAAQIYHAYYKLLRDIESRREFEKARIAYLQGSATNEQLQKLNALRTVAYKGFNGGRVTDSMLDDARLRYFDREVPAILFKEAKKLGVSGTHKATDATGSAEKFGGATPLAYSNQSRPRRQNDDLEPY